MATKNSLQTNAENTGQDLTLAAMPTELDRLFKALWQELAWIHVKWQTYRDLFGHSPERIDLLNKTAPAFFHRIHGSLWEDILLHLCRITDPRQTMSRQNLSLTRLPDAIPDVSCRSEVEEFVERSKENTFCPRLAQQTTCT